MRDRVAWQARLLDAQDRPVGGGVVVDERHVLTCAHVVARALGQPVASAAPPTGSIAVDFLEAEAGPVAARVAGGGWTPIGADGRGDVAVLEVAGTLPRGVEMAPLRRAARLWGHRFDVVGFPQGYDTGVGAGGNVGRPGGPGREWVELQGVEVPGHRVERGFSGAPVFDHHLGAVVGIVVADDRLAEAKLAWMLPLDTLARYWPGLEPLVRAWAVWGPGELEGYWGPRARGVARAFQQGWYFTGRRQVLSELVAWLASGRADGHVRVVTGGPGSGKSAVIARLVTLADPRVRARVPGLDPVDETVPPPGCVDVAVNARGRTLDDLVTAIALATELEADSPEGLIDALGHGGRPRLIVVDALDEASDPASIATRLLRPLAADAASVGVRVLVGTRRGRRPDSPHTITAEPAGELVQALGAGAVVWDLDQPPCLERADLVEYVHRRLLLADEPDAPTPYRGNEALARLVAEAVATRAYPAFLIAQLVSGTLAATPAPVDVSAPDWSARFPASVADAMHAYLDRFGAPARRRVRDLLTPLAYGEGTGLPRDRVWPALASALSGRRYQAEDVDWLLDSAADYLIEQVEADGGLVYRLYHQALVEHLRPPDPAVEQAAQRIISDALVQLAPLGPDRGHQWLLAPAYVRGRLAAHAAAGGLLDELLVDPGFLLDADPTLLLRALPAANTEAGRQAAGVYRSAVHHLRGRPLEEAASFLELAARKHHAEGLAARIGQLGLARPWSARWAVWQPTTTHRVVGRHPGPVSVVALSEVGGRPVVVSGGGDGVVRVWDLASGRLLAGPLAGRTGSVFAVAVGEVGGRPVVVSGGSDGVVQAWELTSGRLVDGPFAGHAGRVTAVALLEVEGRPLAVSGGEDRMVRVWELTSGRQVAGPFAGHTGRIAAIAVGQVGGRPVVVSGGRDETVRVWDLASGRPIGAPLTGHADWVYAVAVGEVDGRTVALTGSSDETVRVWDLASGRPVGGPLTGHSDWIHAVAVGEVDRRPVAVSGGDDEIVRVWDLRTATSAGDPLGDQMGSVLAVAVGELGGRHAMVTAGEDGTVRMWDLLLGRPVGRPLDGHAGPLRALAVGPVEGRLVAITGGEDGTVRVWDLAAGEPVVAPMTGHAGSVCAVAVGEATGRPVAVTGGADKTVRVWDLRAGVPLGAPRTGHADWVDALALGKVGGRPVAVTGSRDQTVRVWDLASGRPVGGPLLGHTDWVNAVAVGTVNGRPVAASAGDDETVRVWDLASGRPVGGPLLGHTGWVNAVAMGELYGQPVAVSGGFDDQTVRIWDLAAGQGRVVEIDAPVQAVAYVQPSSILVATRRGLALLQLRVRR